MRCPTVLELPRPLPHQTGWPWTVESMTLSSAADDRDDQAGWPRITVITPSFNQARFLEATIRSVLLQGYPDLEYFVFDGGSTDGSRAIIEKYAPWLSGWRSEPDGGQSAAINRGLRQASGAYVTWINSDDMLCCDALWTHARQAGFASNDVYVGDCVYIDAHGRTVSVHRARIHDLEDLLSVSSVWRGSPRGHIVQPEVLFPRELALAVGGLDPANHRTMDYELWGKVLMAGATFRYTLIPFGMFRLHEQQKTGQDWHQTQALVATARQLAGRGPFTESRRQELLADLDAYQRAYWMNSGPLARLGLPERTVLSVRETNATLRGMASRLMHRRTA